MGVSGEGDRSVEEEDIDDPGNDGDGCSTLCNIIMKFTLFLTNFIIWLLGAGLLALGIYIQIDESTTSVNFQQALMNLSSLLSNPSIAIIVIGAILFIIGFCGCFGALLEIAFLLIIYAILIGLLILGELAFVAYFFAVQDQAYAAFEQILQNDIDNYYNDASTREITDLIQREILRCCGIEGPDDWQRNIYFNCSSVAFQRCSVPASCCLIEEGEIINLQCGYRTLDVNNTGRYLRNIYTDGCIAQARSFINSNVYVILGAGAGLLVFQLLAVILSASLAVGVRKEKQLANSLKKSAQNYKLQKLQ